MNTQQRALRATNHEIRVVAIGAGSHDADFVCECGTKTCREVIRRNIKEFEAFCSLAVWIPLVAQGHR
jgi:hypothetical protein